MRWIVLRQQLDPKAKLFTDTSMYSCNPKVLESVLTLNETALKDLMTCR
jgi:hypothetical protein